MKKKWIFIFVCCFFLPVFLSGTQQAIAVGEQFRDTKGNLLQAHGGGICEYNGYYYWFGENRDGDILISCYRSRDMKNWEFRNHVLRRSSHPELADANIERPKVIYNPQTGRFVMWAHKELTSDYGQARAAVAVSDTIDGNYTWQRSFRPLDYMSRDCTLFVDDDGHAYFISAANQNYDLNIYKLTNNFLDIASLIYVFDGYHREAPAIFKHNGVYFLFTSGATGWAPNQAQYCTSYSLSGSWSEWKNIGNGTTFDSQSTYIQLIRGSRMTSFLYMGDRWAGAWGGPINDSRYVWLPLNIDSATSLSLSYSGSITIDTDTGLVLNGAAVNESGRTVFNLNDNTTGKGRNQFEYVGSWSYGGQTGAFEEDNHWNSDPNEYYQVRFDGIQVEVYAARAPVHGIAAISVDGGGETTVDFYSGSRSDRVLLYTSPLLSGGSHTLKVRVTGNRNSNATGAAISVDMVKIIVSGGSTPVPANTPKPTTPPTPLPPGTQSLEAEDAYWNNGILESIHAGHSGQGYVNTANETGAYIEWRVNVSGAGSAECSFRYANGAENRPMQLSVNGSTVVSILDFPNTGAWTAWLDVKVSVSLNQGNNTIRITSLVAEGAANIDRMDITTGSSGGICGDVNNNGSIDIVDALMTAQYYVGLNPSGFNAANADANGDGTINIIDALMIAQVYVGLLGSLSC